MIMNRRTLITGLISLVAAPAIVRVQNIMPVRAFVRPPLIHLLAGWEDGMAYMIGDLVQHGGEYYVCTTAGICMLAPSYRDTTQWSRL